MASKTITYPSGAILRRKVNDNTEVWEIDNKSLNDSIFSINLSTCQGIEFKDTKEKSQKIRIKHLEKKELFTIEKTPPFTFSPTFTLEETPISLAEQKKYTQKERDELEKAISKMEDVFKTLPFEVMEEKDLK